LHPTRQSPNLEDVRLPLHHRSDEGTTPYATRRVVAIAAVANLLLLGMFLWSRGGGTTTIRVETSGHTFRAFVDGQPHGPARYLAPASGGIGFRLPPSNAIPSLPGTVVETARVVDSTTGAVLLDGRFDRRPSDWLSTGRWLTKDGALWTPTGGTASTGYRPWRDYVVEARIANLVSGEVYVRGQPDGSGVAFTLRPFRDFDSAFFLRRGDNLEQVQGLQTVETDPLQTTKTILATALRPYGTFLLYGPLAAVLSIAVGLLLAGRSGLVAARRRVQAVSRWIALALAVASFGLLLAIGWVYGDRVPHVPDEMGYLFQAKIFASFHLWAKTPAGADHFSFYGAMVQDGDRWFSQYPFGHPLVLALGELIGAPWLVPPLVGAVTVFCVYLLGRHLYGALVGLLAALLLAASPFFQMTASNFMSHNTGALALVAATLFLLKPGSHPRRSGFVSGLLLGFLFNVRPLTAAAVLVPFVAWLVLEWRSAHERHAAALRAGWWSCGLALMLLAFLLYDRLLTGSFLKTPYSYATLSRDTIGFFGDHSFAAGLMNTETNLALLVLVLHGWPLFVGLLHAALPFLLGTRARCDYFLLSGVLAIVAAWAAYRGVFIMHGPRFWYEAVPYLVLLSARGVQRFVEAIGTLGDLGGAAISSRRALDARYGAAVVSAALVAALLAYSVDGWALGRHEAFPPIEFVPRTMSELRGFNGADARLARLADEKRIHHALVFVRDCPHWQCYGTVFWRNSPRLDGDIVWARDLGPVRDAALLTAFPGRRPYAADYGVPTIEPLRLPPS
jgi:hypothetical protein